MPSRTIRVMSSQPGALRSGTPRSSVETALAQISVPAISLLPPTAVW